MQSDTIRCSQKLYCSVTKSQYVGQIPTKMAKWRGNYYKPRPVWHDRGPIAPPRLIARGPTPPQSTGGQLTRPNRCKPRQSPPANGPTRPNCTNPARLNPGQMHGPTKRANRTGPNPRPNNRPIAGGQSPRKRAKRSTRANPQQNANNPANGANFEVSANQLSKTKKTPD